MDFVSTISGGLRGAALVCALSLWLQPLAAALDENPDEFTQEELNWLAEHPSITVAYDLDWFPVEYVGEDLQMEGISADYLKLLSECLGIEIRPSAPIKWAESIERVRAGKLDFFSAISSSPSREEWLSFTDPYISFPMVIVTRDDILYTDLNELEGRRVSVVHRYLSHDLIEMNHPELLVNSTSSVELGLRAVKTGEAYAFVGNLATISYVIKREKLKGIKVSGQMPYHFDLAMAATKENALLVSILNKAMAQIDDAEKQAIAERWLDLTQITRQSYRFVWYLLAVGALVTTISIYWNYRLDRELARRVKREEAEHKQRLLLEWSGRIARVGYWNFDYVADVLTLSDEVCRIFGVETEGYQPSNRKFLTLVHPEDRKAVHARNRDAAKSGQTRVAYEYRIVRRSGEIRYLSTEYDVQRDDSGKALHSVGMIQDITERKLAEHEKARYIQDLVTAKEMAESANQVKRDFLAVMSHELRTPLNPIIALTDLLLAKEKDDSTSNSLLIIQESGRTLLSLINDILSFCKIESGKLTVTLEDVDLRHLLDQSYNHYFHLAREKGLSFVLELDENLPDVVRLDAIRVGQILGNFLSNAIKFTDSGEVRIRALYVDDTLEVSVVDTGIGIAEDKLREVFRPFTQADSSTTRRYGGSGLGLSICSDLAALLGGHVHVDSTIAKGSTFTVLLPVEVVKPHVEGGATSELSSGDKKPRQLNILAVEDDPGNQMVIRMLLESLAQNVEIVGNAMSALDRVKQTDYDVIFMDIQLAYMSGIQVSEKIRNLLADSRPQPYIIVQTAFGSEETKQQCFDVGVNDYMEKPLDLQKIKKALEKYQAEPTGA